MDHEKGMQMFKALADETRLRIVEMLSCGELCACDILDSFDFTQPTLSYHMKILVDSDLVRSRKDGSWTRYCLNADEIENVSAYWSKLTNGGASCICHDAIITTGGLSCVSCNPTDAKMSTSREENSTCE